MEKIYIFFSEMLFSLPWLLFRDPKSSDLLPRISLFICEKKFFYFSFFLVFYHSFFSLCKLFLPSLQRYGCYLKKKGAVEGWDIYASYRNGVALLMVPSAPNTRFFFFWLDRKKKNLVPLFISIRIILPLCFNDFLPRWKHQYYYTLRGVALWA